MKWRALLIMVIILAVTAITYEAYRQSLKQEIESLTQELRPFIVPEVPESADTPHARPEASLRDRRDTLRLQRYALEQRINPIFALPGTDLALYERMVDALEAQEALIVELWNDPNVGTSSDRNRFYIHNDEIPFLEGFYPNTHLNALGELEMLRRILIASPTPAGAVAYHAQLQKTIEQYIASIDELLHWMTFAEKVKDQSIRYPGGYSRLSYIENTLENYRAIAREQHTRADMRWRCYQGEQDACKPLSLPQIIRGSNQREFPATLPETIAEHSTLTRSLRAEGPSAGRPSMYADVVVLDQSACYSTFLPAYYHVWWRALSDDTEVFVPTLLNELAFYDMFAKDKYYVAEYRDGYLARGGTQYLNQSLTSHYSCPDMDDNAKILTLLFVREFLETFEIGDIVDNKKSAAADLLADMEMLHASIISKPIIYEEEVQQYLALTSELLTEHIHDVAAMLTTETRLSLESLLITYHNQSYGYEALFNNVLSGNWFVPDVYEFVAYRDHIDMLYLRSAAHILLGTANPSIIPIDTSLLETRTRNFDEKLTFYSEIKDSVEPEAFIEDIQTAYKVELEIGLEAGTPNKLK